MSSAISPANYRLLRAALTFKGSFYQVELADQAKASPAQASRVLRWLMDKHHAERQPDGRYRIRGPVSIITSVFPYQRSMADALVATLNVRGTKKEIADALVRARGILCLESALEEYSQFFRATKVSVYHSDPEELLSKLTSSEGGVLPVSIYLPDLRLEGDIEAERRTTKFRTVVDLACDGKVYAAKELLEDLWGVILE